jgi:hypothetical protein
MAFSLERQLPEEIIDHIVSFIPPHVLFNVCLASKTLNRLATTHLYSNMTLGQRSRRDHNLVSYTSPLAHLVFSSSAHAALVKSVVVTVPWGWNEDDADSVDIQPWPMLGSPELEKLLRNQCAKLAINDNEADQVYALVKSGTNEDAILALLLFSLYNMRKLDICFGMFDAHEDFHTVFQLLSKPVQLVDDQLCVPLHVLVKGEDDKYPNDPEQFTIIFHMPRIHAIYGWKMGDFDGDADVENGPFSKLRPRSYPVESIELRCSKLHSDNLQLLMDATIPGKLKTFDYEIGCTWAWCNVEHPVILKSLTAHHATLENLGLSHEDFYPYQFGNEDEQPWPCSFVHFTALKRLKVAPVYIWGHEGFNDQAELKRATTKEMLWKALSMTLEERWITRAQMQVEIPTAEEPEAVHFESACLLPALELVIQHKSEAFPNLAHLRIEFPPEQWRDEWFDSLAILCDTASAHGIQTTVILSNLCQDYRKYVERGWGWDEGVQWKECCQNQEAPKSWIVAADEQDLAQTLRDLKPDRNGEEAKGCCCGGTRCGSSTKKIETE